MPRQFQYYQAPQVDLTRQYSDTVSAEIAASEAFTRPLLVAMEGMIQQKIQRDRMSQQLAMQQQSMAHDRSMEEYRQGEANKRDAAGNALQDRALGMKQSEQDFEHATNQANAQFFADTQPGGAMETAGLGPVSQPYQPPQVALPGTSPSLNPPTVGPSQSLLANVQDNMMRQSIERQKAQDEARAQAQKTEGFRRYVTESGLDESAAARAMDLFRSDEPGASRLVESEIVQGSRVKELKGLDKQIGKVQNRDVREKLLVRSRALNPRSDKFGDEYKRISDAATAGELPKEWRRAPVKYGDTIEIDLETTTFGAADTNRLIEKAVAQDPAFKESHDSALVQAILAGKGSLPSDGNSGELWNKHAKEIGPWLIKRKEDAGIDASEDRKAFADWLAKQKPAPPPEPTKPAEPTAPAGGPSPTEKPPEQLAGGTPEAESEVRDTLGQDVVVSMREAYNKALSETGDQKKAQAAAAAAHRAAKDAPLGEKKVGELLDFYYRSDNPAAAELLKHGSRAEWNKWLQEQKSSTKETLMRELQRWQQKAGRYPGQEMGREVYYDEHNMPQLREAATVKWSSGPMAKLVQKFLSDMASESAKKK